MSWQAYIDTLKGYGNVSFGAIHGHDGSVWATSSELKLQPAEIQLIASGTDDKLQAGVKLNGEKYVFLRKDDYPFGFMVQCRKGNTGATVAKTKQAVVIGIYGEKDQAGGCSDSVAKLAEYLHSAGY